MPSFFVSVLNGKVAVFHDFIHCATDGFSSGGSRFSVRVFPHASIDLPQCDVSVEGATWTRGHFTTLI